MALLICNHLHAQAWLWSKKNLIIGGLNTLPSKILLDGRGNVVMLSLKNDRQILSKHDPGGVLLWKRELFLSSSSPGSSLTEICIDRFDNIYAVIPLINRIDTTDVSYNSPYGLIKFNASGRLRWWRPIDYSPLIFGSALVANGDKLYMALEIDPFETLTYNGTLYTNPAGNNKTSFVAALDTAGTVQWHKLLYAPSQPVSCSPRDAFPQMQVNENQDLFLFGSTTDKLMDRSTPLIDYPYTCKHYKYGLLINGNNGQVKWVKELSFDTLAPRNNTLLVERRYLTGVLSNGYTVVYKCLSRDSSVSGPGFQNLDISNTLSLFDLSGNLLRKDTVGRYDTGWNEILQLSTGNNALLYSSGIYTGPYDGIKTYEAIKWDTLLNPVWKRRTDYAPLSPYFSSNALHYRNNRLAMILQNGTASQPDYAYFGADSILPVGFQFYVAQYTMMADSINIIAGTVFIDNNQNGIKETTEPPATGVLISSSDGSTIYGATDAKGYFELNVAPGTYTIKPLNLGSAYPNHTLVSPAAYTVTISGQGNYIRNRNFALRPPATINDGQINLVTAPFTRPGAGLLSRILVSNPGSIPFTGTCTLRYDTARLVYRYSAVAPVTIAPPELSFNQAAITTGTLNEIQVVFDVKTTAVLSDTIRMKASLNTSFTDAFQQNNTDSSSTIIRAAFDPNVKTVDPFKDIKYDSVTAGRQELEYTIHFQNTGNDTAFAVVIADTIDSKLNLATFRLAGASHPVNLEWKGNRVLHFSFPGIALPDSGINSIRSQGFVQFKMKPQTSILLTDTIRNNVSIYFDYNAPVVTNTVKTSFISNVVTGLFTATFNNKDLLVWPQPASHECFYVLKNSGNTPAEIRLYDISGRLQRTIIERINNNQPNRLSLNGLPAGSYLLTIKTRDGLWTKMIVVD